MVGQRLTGYLFSDIEDSTVRWERDPDAMRSMLARHDAILHSLVLAHGGQIVNHTGDGIFVVFQSADAVTCALEIQRAIQAEDWPGEPLRIRVGIHAGEVDPKDTDFGGVLANRAARVMSAGWGGQILLSDVAASAFARPPGARLENLGLHELKGIPEPVRIYGLTHPDLVENEFPPLRSLTTQARPLPGVGTPFFGRTSELDAITELLAGDVVGAVTVVGPGGYGKTRLATRLAELLGANYPFGAHFVSMELAASAADVVSAIARALGVGFYGSESEIDQLLGYLRDKRGLLILDNAETVTQHGSLIQAIVDGCQGLRLLVTSRTPLGLRGEHVVRLGGLGHATSVAREIRSSPAYQLFVYQARIGNGDFVLADDEAPVFAELYALVGGSPLALELAARSCRVSSLATIVDEVRRSPDVLAAQDRSLPPRHQSVRAVFEYSWTLLSPQEQQLLADLSVFVADFDDVAAKQVARADLPRLRALEAQSLVARTVRDRLHLHPLVRQFAREKLTERVDAFDDVARRHRAYFFGLVPDSVTEVCGSQRGALAERLTLELPNVRAAFAHHVAHATLADVRTRIDPLHHVLRLRGLYQDVIAWFSEALADDRGPDSAEALLLALIAVGRIQQGDGVGAERAATRAIEIGATDELAVAYAEHALGNVAHARGDLDLALVRYERALLRWRALDHELGAYFTTASMAALALVRGDHRAATELVGQSRRLAARLRFDSGMMASFLLAGDLAREQGRLGEAHGCYDRALRLHDGVLDPQMRVMILRRLGTLSATVGDVQLAEQHHREAHALACDAGDRRLAAESQVDLGTDRLAVGDLAGALDELTVALQLARELHLVPVMVRALLQVAVLREQLGDECSARMITASLVGRVGGQLGAQVDALGARLGPPDGPVVAIDDLVDDLVAEHRYGAFPG